MKNVNYDNMSNEDYIYVKIREKIRTGEYPSGYSLKEKELAGDFNVSRTPVRSALKRLSFDGTVNIIPRIGAQVCRITLQKANELLDMREVIDGLAARLAANRISEQQIKELDKLYKEMELHVNSYNLAEYIKLNDKFHCFVAEVSGNKKVEEIIQETNILLMRVQMQDYLLNSRTKQSLLEHKNIISLIKNKKAEEAEFAAKKHVQNVVKTVRDLENSGIYYL